MAQVENTRGYGEAAFTQGLSKSISDPIAPPSASIKIPWSERDIARLLRMGDCLAVLVAGLLAYSTRFFPLEEHRPALELNGLVLGTLVAAEVFRRFGLYDQQKQFNSRTSVSRVLAAWSTVVLLLLAVFFLTQTAQAVSRLWVILWFTYGCVGLLVSRAVLSRQIDRWQQMGQLTRHVALVGADELSCRLVDHIRRTRGGAMQVIGVFDDRRSRIPDSVGGVPVLGTLEDLAHFCRAGAVDQVVITLPAYAEQRLASVLAKLRALPVDVSLCPAVFERRHLSCRRVHLVDSIPLLDLAQRPFSRWGYLLKEVEDRILAALLLIPAAPLMLAIAAAVRLDSGGPVIFRQKRYGFNDRTIEVFKFRTMRVDTSENEADRAVQARRDDPRLTRVGPWLRKSSLDELPQLFNVLRGEMSLIGPRPHMVEHNKQYSALIGPYLARHRVKPGITGWAQVNGWRGETDTLEKMERRVEYDLYYIENWSLSFDLRILILTPLAVLASKNAY